MIRYLRYNIVWLERREDGRGRKRKGVTVQRVERRKNERRERGQWKEEKRERGNSESRRQIRKKSQKRKSKKWQIGKGKGMECVTG